MPRFKRSSSAFRFISVAVIVLSTSTACVTSTPLEARSCPMPDGSLMTAPAQADPIPLEPLKIEGLRQWYLADLERLRGEVARLRALQLHGFTVCGWPLPSG